MAIDFIPQDVGSGFNLTKLNQNFQNIDTALQDALSRSGGTPNQMLADIDLNNNDLLNVSQTKTNELFINGALVTPDALQTIPASVMLKSVYDPQNKLADAFARANHTGTQAVSTVPDAVSKINTGTETMTGTLAAPYILSTYRGLKISEFLTSNAIDSGDQAAQVTAAINALFDGNYINLDFEGKLVRIATKLSFVCGVNGFTSFPTVLRNRGAGIINGGLLWEGLDDPGEFMFELGCPASLTAQAAFQDLHFKRFIFDSRQKNIGSIKLYNFYNALFDDVIFRDFNNEVSVFLRSADNSDVYVDDNGAIFSNCRWACLPTSSNFTGTPIKAYCGDIVVKGGYTEWCGAHDFHIGSVFLENHHWSFAGGTPTEMRVGAVFRDPREIIIQGSDLDNARFKLTNVGFLSGETFTGAPSQTGAMAFHNIAISGNELSSNHVPSASEGWVTFETENAATNIYSTYIGNNVLEVLNNGDDAVPEVVYKTTGAGAYNTIDIIRASTDGFGITAGDGGVDGAPTINGSSVLQEKGRRRTQVRSSTSDTTVVETWFRGTTRIAALLGNGSFSTAGSYQFEGSTADVRSDGANGVRIRGGGTDRWDFVSNGVFRPVVTGTQNIGATTNRVATIFLVNAPDVSSDARLKEDVEEITEADKVAARIIQGLIKRYKMKDGDGRWRYGVIAQEVVGALEATGIDPRSVGFLNFNDSEDESGMMSIAYDDLQMLLLASIGM